jgi:uncharacterized protein YbaR (Trm112 family)
MVLEAFVPQAPKPSTPVKSDGFDEFLMNIGMITQDDIVEFSVIITPQDEEEEPEYSDWNWTCPKCASENTELVLEGETPEAVTCECCSQTFDIEEGIGQQEEQVEEMEQKNENKEH